MKVTLHSHHTPSLLLRNEVRSTPWPDNIWDMSDQRRFFGGCNSIVSAWCLTINLFSYNGHNTRHSDMCWSNNKRITNGCSPHSNTVTAVTVYKHWHARQKLMITLHGLFYNSKKCEYTLTQKTGETSSYETSIPLPNWQDSWNFQSFQYHNPLTFMS
jgi:hypothetical protein